MALIKTRGACIIIIRFTVRTLRHKHEKCRDFLWQLKVQRMLVKMVIALLMSLFAHLYVERINKWLYK